VCQRRTESRIGGQIDHGTEGAGTFIFCSPDHKLEPRLSAHCGAHGTWLEGDVKNAVRKTPIANFPTRLAEDDDLGVGRWIGLFLSTISGAGDYLTIPCEYSAHRNFSTCCSRLALSYSCRHEGVIVIIKNPFRQQHWPRITKGPRSRGPFENSKLERIT